MYMLSFCYFVILISFCDISFVNCYGDIHIRVTDQNNSYTTHDKNDTLYYDIGEVVRLRCTISSNAYGDGKESTVWWVDDHDKVYNSTKLEQFLFLTITLTAAQDGLKLYCKAETKQAYLSLYLRFISNNTESNRLNIFWILIISICGFVGGSIIILIIWCLVSRFCKKNVEECHTLVTFSEDLDITQNHRSRNKQFPETGIIKRSDDMQNGGTENDSNKREDVDNDTREEFNSDRREVSKKNSLYISVEESRRHGSSTEC